MKSNAPVLDRPTATQSTCSAESYRIAMRVTDVVQYKSGAQYAICPRCNLTLEREYQSYCDRCGQHLAWNSFSRAKVHRR